MAQSDARPTWRPIGDQEVAVSIPAGSGLSLSRKGMVRSSDKLEMTLIVLNGLFNSKSTNQLTNQCISVQVWSKTDINV